MFVGHAIYSVQHPAVAYCTNYLSWICDWCGLGMVYNEGVSVTKDFLSSGQSKGTSAEWAVTGQSHNTCRGGPVINQPHPFCTATMESTSEDNLLTWQFVSLVEGCVWGPWSAASKWAHSQGSCFTVGRHLAIGAGGNTTTAAATW